MKGISGPGGTSGKNLIAVYKDAQVIKDENGNRKGAYLQVMLDQSNLTKTALKNNPQLADNDPYLVHQKTKQDKTTSSTYYSDKQLQAIEQAAGGPIAQKDGSNLLAFKGDIMKAKAEYGGQRYIVNTSHDITASDFKHDKNSLDKQKYAIQVGKEAYAAAKQAQAESPEATAESQLQAAVDEQLEA